MELCEEMKKLRKLLTEKGIEWQDVSIIYPEDIIEFLVETMGLERQYVDSTIYRTHFDINGVHYSVINGLGTYGGFEPFENKNHGLLECMIDDNDPIGWLSANDIMDMISGNNIRKE